MNTLSFSLLDQPWVSCQLLDGHEVELSLHETFTQANTIRRLTGELPTTEFATLRLLLAIMYGALPEYSSPEDWSELWKHGLPLDDIHDYLERYRDRFDLLHPETPFYQTAGLASTSGDISGLEKLISDVPNGRPLFTTRLGSGLEQIDFAEAARWLLVAQAFDPSGIKSGIVDDSRTKGGKIYPLGRGWAGYLGGVFVEGKNLLETLLLNFVGAEATDGEWDETDDAPSWHHQASKPGPDLSAEPTGPAALYTWPSRRILLQHDGQKTTGVLLSYGDPLTPQNRHRLEPMSRWRRCANQEKKRGEEVVYMPGEHDPARALWRGIANFIPDHPSAKTGGEQSLAPLVMTWLLELREAGVLNNEAVGLRAVGVKYGSNDSVIDEIIDDTLRVDTTVLSSSSRKLKRILDDTQQLANDAVSALVELCGNIALAGGLPSKPARSAACSQGFAALDLPYRNWLAQLQSDTDLDEYESTWRKQTANTILTLARQVQQDISPTAWQGREVNGRHLSAPLADIWFQAKIYKITRPSDHREEIK